jgi:hypothetical protein
METNNSKSTFGIVVWVLSFFVFGILFKYLQESMTRFSFLIVCSLLLWFTYNHVKNRVQDVVYYFMLSFIAVSGIFWITALLNVF